MDAIKEKIDSSIRNLQNKKNILVRHKTQYNDLKFKLMDFAQYKETDQPTVDVRLNSKTVVKGHIVNPQKVLVFLGCEYFVERHPSKAVSLVENKLKYLNKAINEFETKIKEAEKTIENVAQLEEYERKQAANKEKIPKSETARVSEISEEEELPFMDIREELDEDGNVISSTIQKQDEDRIKQFGEQHGINISDDVDDELNELLQDMEINPRPKIEELRADKEKENVEDKDKNISREEKECKVEDFKKESPIQISEKSNGEKDKKSVKEEPKKVIEELNPKSAEEETRADQDGYYELLKEMGISSGFEKDVKRATTHQAPKSSTPSKPQNEKSVTGKVVEREVKEKETSREQETSERKDWENYEGTSPAIDQDDIIQLQLIADEVEEEADYDYDYDEEDFEHAFDQDDEDEDDEEDDDWDFSPSEDNLIPESHRNLFMKELQRVRAEKAKSDTPVNTIDEPVKEIKKKKSVSFAPELQIKEIENVSEELKNAPDIGKVSKFKQMRMGWGSDEETSYKKDAEEEENENIIERALSETVVEKDFLEPVMSKSIGEYVTSDIIERDEPIVSEAPELPKPKVSKFKQRNAGLGDNTKMNIVGSIASDGVMHPINDNGNGSDKGPVNNIVEREPAVNGILGNQPQVSKPKVSRFKSSKQQLNKGNGNVISIPQTEPHYIPDDNEFSKIKAYIENEEDEEDVLNELTDIQVLRPEDLEGGDEEDEDEEEPIYDGNVLADEIVENDEIDDPSYYVDENLLQKEYQDLRRKMINQYLKPELGIKDEDKIVHKEEENAELEPIDEHGNPIRVSRFRKSYK